MPLKGSVEALGLTEIFEIIHAGGYSGVLKVGNDQITLPLPFYKGTLYYRREPSTHRYKLGSLLVRTTALTEKQLQQALAVQEAEGGRLGDILVEKGFVAGEDVGRILLEQYREEVYDLFLWREAWFEFLKDELPEGFVEEVQAGRAQPLHPPNIVMEAANRIDEWKRIRAMIPSQKLIYREVPEKSAEIDGMLSERKIDKKVRLDGTRNLAQIFEAWKYTQFELYRVIFELIHRGAIEAVPTQALRSNVEGCLLMGYFGQGLRYYEAAVESGRSFAETAGLDALVFGPRGVVRATHEVGFSVRTTGKRALAIFLEMFRRRARGRLTIAEGENRRVVNLTDEFLGIETWGTTTPAVVHYAMRRRLVTPERVEEAVAKSERSRRSLRAVLVDDGYISPEDWIRVLTDKLIDEVVDVFFWREPLAEFSNRPDAVWGERKARMRLQMPFSLPGFLEEMESSLERVRECIEEVPSVRAVFRDAREGGGRRDLLAQFNGRRSVDDLLRRARSTRQDFLLHLHEALAAGQLRRLTREEYLAEVDLALSEERFHDAQTLCRSAIDADIEPEHFRAKREAARYLAEEAVEAVLEGDFETLSLAEILQSLHRRQASGTLQVTSGKRERSIYFEGGGVFVLREQAQEISDEVADLFLDTDVLEKVESTFGGSLVERGLVSEDEISEAEATSIKEEVWDMFLWEDARFVFSRNVLPPEFFSPPAGTTRLGLHSEGFLLEAIRRITEWEALKAHFPNASVVLQFESTELKMKAIAEKGAPELLYLVDGRKTLAELVRISGMDRTSVYRIAAELESEGAIKQLAAVPVPPA